MSSESLSLAEAGSARPSRKGMSRATRRKLGHRAIATGLCVLAVVWLLPLVYMVDVSLRLPQDTFNPDLIVSHVTLSNYQTVIAGNPLGQYFINSVVIAVVTVVLVVAFASAFCYAVTILGVRFGAAMYTMILLTLMVPIASLIVPIASVLGRLGMINTDQGLILPYTAIGIPFAVVLLRGFMQALPHEVIEAATIDGAAPFRIFRSVVLPMLRPSLVFIAAWQFMTSWNELFLATVVESANAHKTLPQIPQFYEGTYLGQPGAVFAILCIVAIPLLLVYIVVQRWFVGGLLAGAVKG